MNAEDTLWAMPETNRELMARAMGQPLEYKIHAAVGLLKAHATIANRLSPEHGYWLAYSGGKDSGVIMELARMAGVKFRPVFNLTLEPPELLQFIRRHHPEVEWNTQERGILRVLAESTKGPPTRLSRWCCEYGKESGGDGTVKIIGVRAAESKRRGDTWRQVTNDKRTGVVVCPILYWTDEDVWEFHRMRELPYCSLYDEGYKRLGCIGCPMAGRGRLEEFKRWPKYEAAWKRAVRLYWERCSGLPLERPKWTKAKGGRVPDRATQTREHRDGTVEYLRTWRWFEDIAPDNWEQLWDWWLYSDDRANKPGDDCQMEFLFV